MSDFSLLAISPIDGRYKQKTNNLIDFFSEFALIKYRIIIEIEYFLSLTESGIPILKNFPNDKKELIKKIYTEFSLSDAQRIKDIEKITNHDVKAVEYFIKEKFETFELNSFSEWIHFGLTSQDINNTAIPLTLKESFEKIYLPKIQILISFLKNLSQEWKDISVLAKTHGQPASPTKLGKEFQVFSERLENQLNFLLTIPFAAKFGGATGNFNAHHVAFPQIDWVGFSNHFINEKLLLKRSQTTTQIEHYDFLACFFDGLRRINTIVLDLNRDCWLYISMDYFKQKLKKGEVGSSAMPHKVNPIDFENSEGNIGIANCIFDHFSNKLPVSRLQRDLSDSTVLRNIGVPIAHSLIAFDSTLKGLEKLILNEEKISNDLNNNWAVVAEAIQTILRREGVEKPYEMLKDLSRTNQILDKNEVHRFIDNLPISDLVKAELKLISPENYTGINLVR
ncbi:MAG: adenylosuccinate lyase [Flavobacteriia bacterium]|nr:adenylosuccinate lyase [Flavobacteriia bacterium]